MILLQQIIDLISTGILVINEEGRIELFNEQAGLMFQSKPLEWLEDLNRFREGLTEEFL